MYVCIFLGELTNNVLASWHVWGRQVVDISAMLIKMQFQSEGLRMIARILNFPTDCHQLACEASVHLHKLQSHMNIDADAEHNVALGVLMSGGPASPLFPSADNGGGEDDETDREDDDADLDREDGGVQPWVNTIVLRDTGISSLACFCLLPNSPLFFLVCSSLLNAHLGLRASETNDTRT